LMILSFVLGTAPLSVIGVEPKVLPALFEQISSNVKAHKLFDKLMGTERTGCAKAIYKIADKMEEAIGKCMTGIFNFMKDKGTTGASYVWHEAIPAIAIGAWDHPKTTGVVLAAGFIVKYLFSSRKNGNNNNSINVFNNRN